MARWMGYTVKVLQRHIIDLRVDSVWSVAAMVTDWSSAKGWSSLLFSFFILNAKVYFCQHVINYEFVEFSVPARALSVKDI